MFVRIISATKAEHVKVFHAGISRLILFPMMTVSGSMKPSSSASGSDLPITVSHGRINLMSRVFHRKTFFSGKKSVVIFGSFFIPELSKHKSTTELFF